MYYVNSGSVYAIAIAFPVLCTISVAFRFTARRQRKLAYGLDDWAALVTLIPLLACAIVMIIGAAMGIVEYHSDSVTAEEPKTVKFALLEYIFNPISVLAICGVRLTFVLLYRRIFRGNTFYIASQVILVVIVLWTIVFFFASFFLCSPISAFWASSEIEYALHCTIFNHVWLVLTVTDTIMDIYLLVLPIGPIYKLQMGKARKASLVVVFSLGIFSIGAGTPRIAFLAEFSRYKEPVKVFGLNVITDRWEIIGTILWWSYMEIGAGCLASNLPPLVGLIRGQAFTRFMPHKLMRGARRKYMDQRDNSDFEQPIVLKKTQINIVPTEYGSSGSLGDRGSIRDSDHSPHESQIRSTSL